VKKNYDDYVKPFSYNTSVSRTDGQTDGRTDGQNNAISISRDKNDVGISFIIIVLLFVLNIIKYYIEKVHTVHLKLYKPPL